MTDRDAAGLFIVDQRKDDAAKMFRLIETFYAS
jgi:hypothetical protein